MVQAQTDITEQLKSIRLSKAAWWTREITGILLWIIIASGIFIDYGNWIIQYSPSVIRDIWKFRLAIVLLIISVGWIVFGTRPFVRLWLYVILYPVVFILWRIPQKIFYNWQLLVVFAPALHAFFSFFKYNMFLLILAITSVLYIIYGSLDVLVMSSCATIMLFLLNHYVRRFRFAFAPRTIYGHLSDITMRIMDNPDTLSWRKGNTNGYIDPQESRSQQYFTSAFVMLSLLRSVAHKLKSLFRSSKYDIYLMSTLVYTAVLTVLSYGFIYYGIDRLDEIHFNYPTDVPALAAFLGYSFTNLLTSDISSVTATSQLSAIASYSQLIFTIAILLLFGFMILTSVRDRFKTDAAGLVTALDDTVDKLGQQIEVDFNMTILDFHGVVIQVNPTIVKLLGEHDPGFSLPPSDDPVPSS